MKKLFSTILVICSLLCGNAYADKEDLRRGASKLGSVSDAYWEQNTLVIHLLEPKTNFRSLGSSICRGGAQYYQVEKNYQIADEMRTNVLEIGIKIEDGNKDGWSWNNN